MTVRCSRCGTKIVGPFVQIKTQFQLNEITEEGLIVSLPNANEPTSEILCTDCFNKYAEAIDVLNQDSQNIYMSNMVEVVDEIQYDNRKV